MITQQFIDKVYPISKVLKFLRLTRSSNYHQTTGTVSKGCRCSIHTHALNGSYVSNQVVVKKIQRILSGEFVDNGYLSPYKYIHCMGIDLGKEREL